MKKSLLLLAIVIRSVVTSQAQYTNLLNFDGVVKGSTPSGSLISDGTFFYGITYGGGANTLGTLFKIQPDGTGYSKLLDFDSTANGSNPIGSLMFDGTFLYGTTNNGGINSSGTLFKIQPDGTGFSKLFDFNDSVNGSHPIGSLISDGTYLYGVTIQGGPNGDGTIFRIKPDGTEDTTLIAFNGVNGNYPGSLITDGTYLYGTTYKGGVINNYGTLFKIKTDGTGYTNLLDFDSINGSYPIGSLISDGTFLYGTTSSGGENNLGTVFKIQTDGSDYRRLFDFNGMNGSHPVGSLISDLTYLYGETTQGGTNDYGILYKIKTDGTDETKLLDFDGINGQNPVGCLLSDGTFLYGITAQGGANNLGTLFRSTPFASCIAYYTTSYDSTFNTFTLDVDSVTTALAIAYDWNFGDGSFSTLATPSHTYGTDGLYNVCMTIHTSTGDSCMYCHTIGIDSLGNVIRDVGFVLNVHNATTGVSQNSINETLISIFPNPNSGIFQLTIDNEQSKNEQLSIFNLIGEKVYSINGKQLTGTINLDLSDQPAGIYFMQLKTSNNTVTKKIVINK